MRLIGALLAEQNEVWQERRYPDIDEFAEWVAARAASGERSNVVALAGGKPYVIERTEENLQQFLDLTPKQWE